MGWLRRQIRELVDDAASPKTIHKLGQPLLSLVNRHPHAVDLSQARKILVIRLDGLGDVLMTTPFLRELRRNAPSAEINLVVKPPAAELLELCPYVDHILTYDPRVDSPRWGVLLRHLRALRFARREVWTKHYDLALVPRWDAYFDHEPFLAYFSGISERVAFAENVSPAKTLLSLDTDRLFTRVIHESRLLHEVEYSLEFLRQLGGSVENDEMELRLSARDEATAENFLKRSGAQPGEKIVGLGVGASLPRRVWPVDRFIRVAQELRKRYGFRVMVVGGAAEAPQAREFARQMGGDFINAQKENFSIRETAALLKRCHLYFGNNTGPMHLAAIFKVPVIELSCHPASDRSLNDNSPARFKAWRTAGVVLQPAAPTMPCHDSCAQLVSHCIQGISVEQSLRECGRFIDAMGSRPQSAPTLRQN